MVRGGRRKEREGGDTFVSFFFSRREKSEKDGDFTLNFA